MARGQDPYYTVIDKSDGLPSGTIYDLFQDSKGFIWIGSNEGLTRYDGFEFKTYFNPGQTSTAGNQIREDKYGRIWYKNFDSYLYYVKDDSLYALKQNTTIGNSCYAILNDRLLVLQKNGVDIFDLASLRLLKTIPLDHTQTISQITYQNHLYIASVDCMYKISAEGDIEKIPVKGISEMMAGNNSIMVINKINVRGYWDEVKGNALVHKFATPKSAGFIHSGANCGGYYWLFTPTGGWAFNEDGSMLNNGKPLFAAFGPTSVLKDRDGNYWFGTLNDGILVVPDMDTKLITAPGFEPGTLLTMDSLLYVGTKNNEIFTYNAGTAQLEKKYAGAQRHEVLALGTDPAHTMIYAAADFFTIRDRHFKELRRSSRSVKDIVPVDGKYEALAASGAIELMQVKDGPPSAWDSLFNAAPPVACTCVLKDVGRGRAVTYNPATTTVYIGSNQGLHAISPRKTLELRFCNEPIYPSRLEYYKGSVYALTPQGNLYRIDGNNTIRQLDPQGERSNQLHRAGDGLYLLTRSGIKILDTISGKFLPLAVNSNFHDEKFNDVEQVGKTLMLSSDRGLIIVDPSAHPGKRVPPGFTINEISVNGKKVGAALPAELPFHSSDIEIRYSILSFNAGSQYSLFYKVNEGDYKSVPNLTRTLRLASLAPGIYDLSFKLQDAQGNEFAVKNLKFTIRKPFWHEWWFWGICSALVSAGAYTYYKWQTVQLKRQNALRLEKMELEKNLRNSMLTSIRAQMNPHFFYNALNTIQAFIFSDDKRNASTYLVKLSKLTRKVLEMSEKDTISLEEETEALKIYLELEKIRFNDDFDYQLLIGKGVDSELVRIPPMIVQPYVENAIKHGLLHKKGEKKLSVEFAKKDHTLCITIDDNGVGRKKAGELANAKKGNHISFSTDANSKRIELLNKGRTQDIGVVYIDKINEAGASGGTSVTISIPLN